MSFQDVGKPGSAGRPKRSHLTGQPSSIPEGRSSGGGGGDPFAQLSDGILQYQRNVGILEKIIRQFGTANDGPELETQYDAQVDVLQQLGSKLETTLRLQDTQHQSSNNNSNSNNRTDAAKRRATVVKLNRDFRRVEASSKNMILEAKQRRSNITQQRKSNQQQQAAAARTTTTGSNFGTATTDEMTQEEQKMQLELQLQTDRLNEEIMQEREHEIRNINHGMHKVNEIYKDLANIVGSQQEQVDQIEGQMEDSRANAEQGLGHIQKANEKASASQCAIS
mmetsp:Transcript_31273/g.51619  ORF Transcript_31273/g.51619 Transcript_31273/m.51619 type:complete len:280 (+) Transcript_31273:133-972(+)